MMKIFEDGVVKEVPDPVDGPEGGVVTESPQVVNFGNSVNNPVGVVGPLEGKNNDGISVSEVHHDTLDAMVNTPGKVSEANKELRDELKKELETRTVEPEVLRKIESEGRAAADRDMPQARDLPHIGPNEPDNADKTAVRDDGTVTTENHPELTATYLHGTRVLITDAQRAEYDALLAEMEKLQGDAGISDIPVSDPYWEKKKQLDAFVARLKR